MTEDEALEILWSAKNNHRDAFLWAKLTEDVGMREWNGHHPVEENEDAYVAKAGSTVLITMVSRFGDVGIRARNLNPPSHGYHARVLPEKLTDWTDTPPPVDHQPRAEEPMDLESGWCLIPTEP